MVLVASLMSSGESFATTMKILTCSRSKTDSCDSLIRLEDRCEPVREDWAVLSLDEACLGVGLGRRGKPIFLEKACRAISCWPLRLLETGCEWDGAKEDLRLADLRRSLQ